MKRYSFKRQFSKKNLKKIIDINLKFNTAHGIDNIKYNSFINNIENNISVINDKVISGTYKFTPYKEKLILKSRESLPRVISIPTLRDRIVLKSLQLLLKEVYPSVNLKLPQICIQELKENIPKYNYFIKLDISNFYGSICHGILINKIKNKVNDETFISTISKAIKTPTVVDGISTKGATTESKGVPQGIPISNILASIYLHDLDSKYLNREEITYIRYVDDILILCQENQANIIYEEIVYDIEAILNLPLNSKKTVRHKISTVNPIEFLGYKYGAMKNDKLGLSVKNANKLKFENSIIAVFHKYQNDSKMSSKQFIFSLNNKITGSITNKFNSNDNEEHKYGWLFYFSQIEDLALLYHFDYMIEKLLEKFPKCKIIDRSSIKYFVKAFFEIRYNIKESEYIHRPDSLSKEEKVKLLKQTFNIKEIKEENIDRIYYKCVYNPIQFEQKDIQRLIS